MRRIVALLILIFGIASCNNNPYGKFPEGKVIFTAMDGDPRTLDPSRVGDTASNSIASNIHDTPFEYEYLTRPLTLKPAMATSMPVYGTAEHKGKKYPSMKFSIKKGLRYMDDACFPDGKGREILIDDIIYSIKRASDLAIDPFGYPMLSEKVLGFDEYGAAIQKKREQTENKIDIKLLYTDNIEGVRKLDDYTLELLLLHEAPQVIYFFSLTVGSPAPKECVAFYNGKDGKPTYDRHPVASGPFYIKEWHPNYRMILSRNPNYRQDDFFPASGNKADEDEGLLLSKGKKLPIVDEVRMQIIQTSPPIWTLFEQGYLDRAGIPREVFQQVISGQDLSTEFKSRGIRLDKDIDISSYWWYFNLNDPLFASNVTLRQALSMVVDRKEMIDRFYNGRGIPAQSLIPPGIEGYFEDYKNPLAEQNLTEAKRLLTLAGYKDGIDPKTGKPLTIRMTLVESRGASSLYRFYIDQYSKVGIDLKIEQLDWPTVLEKKNKKEFQMIHGGWHADYPDPQNFLQLFYGPNVNGPYNENNYQNKTFDQLYNEMKDLPSGEKRKSIIRKMLEISGNDAHVVYLFHPVSYGLTHEWIYPLKPHPINTNQLKYRDLDQTLRLKKTEQWNSPPLYAWLIVAGTLFVLFILMAAAVIQYRRMGR